MGNTLIDNRGRLNLMKSFETHNTEQDIGVRQRRLSDNKLFKSMHYKMHNQNLVVKVHLIFKQLTHNELYLHYQNFQYLMEKLDPYPNLMAFRGLINFGKIEKPSPQEMQNECNKDYLAVSRQMLYMTLEERLQSNYTLPKCLLNFYTLQLLSTIKTLHSLNLYHGHIRTSNILLTSLDYLVLTDFASYKPYYSNEFEVIRNVFESSIQKCTLAPEKYAETQDIQYIANLTNQQLKNLQQMDMFSVGCVLFEIYTGESLFSFKELLKYRKQEFDPLIKVEGMIGDLICNLIDLDPNQRYTAEKAFYNFEHSICADETFELLHKVCYTINYKGEFMHPDIRIALLRQIISSIKQQQWTYVMPVPLQFISLNQFNDVEVPSNYPNRFSQIIFKSPLDSDRLVNQIENAENLDVKVQDILGQSKDYYAKSNKNQKSQVLSGMLCLKTKPSTRRILFDCVRPNYAQKQNEYIIFILWIFNSMRNCRFLQTRLCGLELVKYLIGFIDDPTLYQLIIPNLGQFCEDYEGQTQFYAFSIFLDVLKRCNYPYNSQTESLIFKLYVWEQIKTSLQNMSQNPILALKIGDIAEVLHLQNRTEEMNQLLQIIQKKLQDENQEESILIIQNIQKVLTYYDSQQTIEIMKLLIAQLNKYNLKIPLLEVGFDILNYYAKTDMKKTFLTCLQLNIRDELALFHTLRIVNKASQEQLLELDKTKQYIKEISPLVLHHNLWIRDEAQNFIIIQLKKFNSLDIYLYLLPHIKKYLKEDVPHLDEDVFKNLVQKPISKQFWNKNTEFISIQSQNQRKEYNYKNYYEEYIQKSNTSSEVSIQKTYKIQNLPSTSVLQRLSEFFESCFRLKFLKQDSFILMKEFIKKEKNLEYFNNFSNINFGIDLKKHDQNKLLDSQSFKSSTQWINYLNFNIIINSFIQKSFQLNQPQIKYQRSVLPKTLRQFKIKNQLVTTIPEHNDIVTSLQKYSDQRRFLSASYDGSIRVYDINKIQEEFTFGSYHQIKISNEQDKIEKVNALCLLEGTENFVVGTNYGQVSLYKNFSKQTTYSPADSGIRKIVDYDNAFCYVTEKGSLILEDIRSRNTQHLSVNNKCGLVTSLIHDNYYTILSTLNGYLMLYDNRNMMQLNIYQLMSKNDQPLPIFNLSYMNRNSTQSSSDNLLGIGYQSLNNEVAFFDVKINKNILEPKLFLHCSQKKNPSIEMPKLKSILDVEHIVEQMKKVVISSNYSGELKIQRSNLNLSSISVKEQLINNMKKNYLDHSFQDSTSVTSLLCLSGRGYNQKIENTIVTATKDRSVQSWTLNSDINNYELEFQTNVICSPYNSNRKFKQYMKGDVFIIEDYEIKNSLNTFNSLEHQDSITDMIYLDNENGYLVTASKDHKIKIWQ